MLKYCHQHNHNQILHLISQGNEYAPSKLLVPIIMTNKYEEKFEFQTRISRNYPLLKHKG